MLSTSKIGNFCLSEPKPNDKLFKKARFSSHMASTYDKYTAQLNQNAYSLKKKYSALDLDYIKQLLEEFQNNIQMVSDIIQEEQKKHIKSSMEQERSEAQSIFSQSRKDHHSHQKIQDSKVLKKCLAKLYKKLSEQQRQKQEIAKKYALLLKQNQNLKLMNQQLLKQQMNEADLINNLDIC